MVEVLRVAVGVAAAGAGHVLDLGPTHPAGMGGWALDVTLNGDVIASADPRIGFTHRSDEKVLEARDYRQGLLLAGRHDWFASTSSELCFALAVEAGLGIVPSAHVTWSRTLLAEVVRVQALLLLAGGALAGGDVTHPAATMTLAHRERLLGLIEQATGELVHPMFTRIGGIAAPFAPDWLTDLGAALDAVRTDLSAITDAARTYAAPFAGVGILDRQRALDLGASGPVGRASGIDLDLRRDEPYLAYTDLRDALATRTASAGDVPARYDLLLADLGVALNLAGRCIEQVRMHAGEPVEVSLPKTIRVPEGTTVASVEGPVGLTSVLLDSRGDRAPWRVKLRTPSFAHVQAMASAAVGATLDQLPAVAMSFFFAVGDADR